MPNPDATPVLRRPVVLTLLACLATLLWGTAFPAVKSGYTLFEVTATADRLVFAGIRFFGAGLAVVLAGSLLRRKPLIPAHAWGRVCVLGFVQTVLQYMFFYLSMAHTTGAKGSVINSSSAFIGVIMAHFFVRDDRMTRPKALGCLLGLMGVIAVNLGPMGGFSMAGDGAMLLAAVAEAGAGLVSKWTTKKTEPAVAAGWQLFLGGGALWIVGLLCGGKIHVSSLAGWILLAYLMMISSVSYTIWTLLLKWNPVAKVSIFLSLVPVFGLLSSGIVLGEPIFLPRNLIGLLLVSSGIYIVNRVPSRRQ